MRRRTVLAAGGGAGVLVAIGYVVWPDDDGGSDDVQGGWHESGTDDALLINRKLRSVRPGDEVRLPFSTEGYGIKTSIRIPQGVALVCPPDSPIRALRDLKVMVTFQGPNGRLQGAALDSGSSRVGAMVNVEEKARNAVIENCDLQGGEMTTIGVRAHGRQTGCAVAGCSITGPATGVSLVGSGRGMRITDTVISKWQQRGVYVQQRGNAPYVDVTIRDNTVEDMREGGVSRYPIVVTGTETKKTRKLAVQGNTVRGANRSWRDPDAPGTADQIAVRHARSVDISDNSSWGGGDVGITVAHCHNGEVRNNHVWENDTAGIYIGTRSGNSMGEIVVEGNRCENNGQNRHGDRKAHGRAGIRVTEGGRVVLRRNVISDTQESRTQLSGITLDGAPRVTLELNSISGVKTKVMRAEK